MISKLEKDILLSLNNNGRKSFRKVAKEVGSSTTSIYNNVKKLEKTGLIKGYIPLLNPEILGYKLIAIITLRIKQSKTLKIQSEISKFPQVRAVYDITGNWDSILICNFKDRKDLDKFLKTRLSLLHVERFTTHIVLDTIKNDKRTPIL